VCNDHPSQPHSPNVSGSPRPAARSCILALVLCDQLGQRPCLVKRSPLQLRISFLDALPTANCLLPAANPSRQCPSPTQRLYDDDADDNNNNNRRIHKPPRPQHMEFSRRKLSKRPPSSKDLSPASLAASRISTASSSRSVDTADSLNATTSLARLSLTQHSATHLIGPAFDAEAIINTISYGAASQHASSTLPQTSQAAGVAPPTALHHAHTYDESWRKMERVTPPRSDMAGSKSPRQRYSDEPRPDNHRKKSMFSSILNGVKGSPRRPTISTPTNPTHVTHVSIDNETGQYTVRSELIGR
jgi:hypothetical protein